MQRILHIPKCLFTLLGMERHKDTHEKTFISLFVDVELKPVEEVTLKENSTRIMKRRGTSCWVLRILVLVGSLYISIDAVFDAIVH